MITPDFVGQIYKDTATGNLWRANSTTPGDWTLELQNCGYKWLPTSIKMSPGNIVPFVSYEQFAGLTKIIFTYVEFTDQMDFESTVDLIEIEWINLTTITSSSLFLNAHQGLTTISFPELISSNSFDCSGNPLLTTVSAPKWIPTNTKTYRFNTCALSSATVNHLLARAVSSAGFVSGLLNLSGGTSQAPTGQGITDKATLNARQAGLALTN